MTLFNFKQKCHNVIEWYNKRSITFLSKGLKAALNYICYEAITNELPQPDILAIFVCSTGILYLFWLRPFLNWAPHFCHIPYPSPTWLGTSGNNKFHPLKNTNWKSTMCCHSCCTKAYSSFMWIMWRRHVWMQHWRGFDWGEQFLLDMV